MTPYEQLAQNINGIAGTNVATGQEPMTIASRRNLGGINNRMTLSDMARARKHQMLMQQFQAEQLQKQGEADPLDFLSVIPGIGNIIGGIDKRDQAGAMSRRSQYGPAY